MAVLKSCLQNGRLTVNYQDREYQKYQCRSVITDGLDLRAIDTEEPGYKEISGYFVRYNSPSQEMYDTDGTPFKEIIMPNAFDEWLEEQTEIHFLAHHNIEDCLGRRSTGSFKIIKDLIGLRFVVNLPMPAPDYVNKIIWQIEHKRVAGCSFGFIPTQEDVRNENGNFIVEVRKAKLFEGSIVTNPAYLATSAKVRSINNLMKAQEPVQDLNRERAIAQLRNMKAKGYIS